MLAQRLRALREEHWRGSRISQEHLARAIGVSIPLISAWESRSSPTIPPPIRVDAYVAIFATRRSLTGSTDGLLRIVSPADLTAEERDAAGVLRRELTQLRSLAVAAQHAEQQAALAGKVRPAPAGSGQASGLPGPWSFTDGDTVTLVCAQWPDQMRRTIPYTDPAVPDYIELLTYSELDSMFELFGHLREVNPGTYVTWRPADRVRNDDYTSHLVSLGGVDWNQATTSLLETLAWPVRQIADWSDPDGQFFEADADDGVARHRPVLDRRAGPGILREDVALFARAVNPSNRERTVTICLGMYGRGTYGVVRALTDRRFHERNAGYLRSRFGSSPSYCLLSRVKIMNNETITPDWTDGSSVLFEWSDGPHAGG